MNPVHGWLVARDWGASYSATFRSQVLAGQLTGFCSRVRRLTMAFAGVLAWMPIVHSRLPVGPVAKKASSAHDLVAASHPTKPVESQTSLVRFSDVETNMHAGSLELDDWRRTVDGWERASSWNIRKRDSLPAVTRVHPAVLASLQVLLSIGSLLAFSKYKANSQ